VGFGIPVGSYLGGFRFDLGGAILTLSNCPIDSSPASNNLKIIATGSGTLRPPLAHFFAVALPRQRRRRLGDPSGHEGHGFSHDGCMCQPQDLQPHFWQIPHALCLQYSKSINAAFVSERALETKQGGRSLRIENPGHCRMWPGLKRAVMV